MTLKSKVNDPHFQYQLRVYPDAYLGQIWWYQLKSVMNYHADKVKFTDSRMGQMDRQKYPFSLKGQGVITKMKGCHAQIYIRTNLTLNVERLNNLTLNVERLNNFFSQKFRMQPKANVSSPSKILTYSVRDIIMVYINMPLPSGWRKRSVLDKSQFNSQHPLKWSQLVSTLHWVVIDTLQ